MFEVTYTDKRTNQTYYNILMTQDNLDELQFDHMRNAVIIHDFKMLEEVV